MGKGVIGWVHNKGTYHLPPPSLPHSPTETLILVEHPSPLAGFPSSHSSLAPTGPLPQECRVGPQNLNLVACHHKNEEWVMLSHGGLLGVVPVGHWWPTGGYLVPTGHIPIPTGLMVVYHQITLQTVFAPFFALICDYIMDYVSKICHKHTSWHNS